MARVTGQGCGKGRALGTQGSQAENWSQGRWSQVWAGLHTNRACPVCSTVPPRPHLNAASSKLLRISDGDCRLLNQKRGALWGQNPADILVTAHHWPLPWPHRHGATLPDPQISCIGLRAFTGSFLDGLCFQRLAPNNSASEHWTSAFCNLFILLDSEWKCLGVYFFPQAAWSQWLTYEREYGSLVPALDAWRPVRLWGFIHSPQRPEGQGFSVILCADSQFLSWKHFIIGHLLLLFHVRVYTGKPEFTNFPCTLWHVNLDGPTEAKNGKVLLSDCILRWRLSEDYLEGETPETGWVLKGKWRVKSREQCGQSHGEKLRKQNSFVCVCEEKRAGEYQFGWSQVFHAYFHQRSGSTILTLSVVKLVLSLRGMWWTLSLSEDAAAVQWAIAWSAWERLAWLSVSRYG